MYNAFYDYRYTKLTLTFIFLTQIITYPLLKFHMGVLTGLKCFIESQILYGISNTLKHTYYAYFLIKDFTKGLSYQSNCISLLTLFQNIV